MAKKRSLPWFFAAALLIGSGAAWAELTLEQAIEKVQREHNGKVLGAETVYLGEQKMYRIKVLTRDGQVRVFQIPADDK